jgi:hypothetical protein
LPNERLDCETVDALFRGVDLAAVRDCLKEMREPRALEFRLMRSARPELRLQETEDTPACARTALATLPVPREIIFQSMAEGHLTCYASRLDIEADQVLGARVPWRRMVVRAELPLDVPPETDAQTARVVTGWVLSPFWGEAGRQVDAKIVPDSICRTCLGTRPADPSEALDLHPGVWP